MTTVDLTPQDDRPALPDPGAPGSPAGPDLPGPQIPDVVTPDLEVVPEVSEDKMRRVLSVIGLGAHMAVGNPHIDEHWAFTDGELDVLTPPLTAYVNRSQRLRAAVDRGDIVTVVVGLGLYAKRNLDLSAEIAAAEDLAAADGYEVSEPDAAGDPTDIQPWGSIP